VCIPVYGVEKYIERCARSLFEQTMSEGIEFIFVNDCTKDKSIEILEQVLSEYPQRKDQVKIIHHEKNGGLVAARNTGLEHATGDYIIHCDSDDWVDLNMYETMYNKAIKTNADMVYCDFYESDGKISQKVSKQGHCTLNEFINELLFKVNNRSLCDKLFKKEIALDYNWLCPEHIVMGEDLLRVIQMVQRCHAISHISEPLYFYRCNLSSVTKAKWKKSILKSLIDIADLLPKLISQEKYYSAINYFKCSILFSMIKHPESTSAKEFYAFCDDIGYKNIKNAMQIMDWQRKLLLRIALVNYKAACIMTHTILWADSLVSKIKK
ncbi:MAG: glycosyltransferase family 2 protein, partial [Lentisphaeria bacterium]|nr:glycosyltransferase family 2 protein [Lentisphaeria bacterium]